MPSPNLPIVPLVGVQAWSDLAVWAMSRPAVAAKVGLFANDYTPDANSVLASFQAPTAAGLQDQPLGVPVRAGLNASGRSIWTWPLNTFVAAGGGLPQIVYGYYVYCVDPWTGLPALVWCQRLVNPFGFFSPGDSLPIPLSASFGQC